MGLYIRGMEMPSCCMFCPISNSAGCGLSNPPIIMTSKEMLAGHPDWCPLVPVPPHGRLGDLDELEQDAQKRLLMCSKNDNQFQAPYEVMRAIALAPSIIPASEGE